jgi:hypothetical protein
MFAPDAGLPLEEGDNAGWGTETADKVARDDFFTVLNFCSQ